MSSNRFGHRAWFTPSSVRAEAKIAAASLDGALFKKLESEIENNSV